MILADIKQRRREFLETIYDRGHREANGEVHRIAKMATTMEPGRHVWLNDTPEHLCIPSNVNVQ
jgi:hypothetical protein